MCILHLVGIVGLSLFEKWESAQSPKLEPTRISIQLVTAKPPPPKPPPPKPPADRPPQPSAPKPPAANLPSTQVTPLSTAEIPSVALPQIPSESLTLPEIAGAVAAPNIPDTSAPAPTSRQAPTPEIPINSPRPDVVLNAPTVPTVRTPRAVSPVLPQTPRVAAQPNANRALPPLAIRRPTNAPTLPVTPSNMAPERPQLQVAPIDASVPFTAPEWTTDPVARQPFSPDTTSALRERVLKDTPAEIPNSEPLNSVNTGLALNQKAPVEPVLPSSVVSEATEEPLTALNLPAGNRVTDLPDVPVGSAALPIPPDVESLPELLSNAATAEEDFSQRATDLLSAGIPSQGEQPEAPPQLPVPNLPPPPAPPPAAPASGNLFAANQAASRARALSGAAPFDPSNAPRSVADNRPVGLRQQDINLARQQRNERAQQLQVQRRYNSVLLESIRGKIKAPQRFDDDLEIAIELEISLDGAVKNFRVKESSGSEEFDLTVLTGLRALKLPRLPEALSEDPPYIVTVRVRP